MIKPILSLVGLSLLASFSSAQLLWSGTIDANDPTYNRLLQDGSALSGVGTAVGYDVQAFYVSATGAYNFESGQSWDGFIFVYANSFNAATPLANYQAGSDDVSDAFSIVAGTFSNKSRTDASHGAGSMVLTANTQYYAVTTSFGNGGTGDYSNGIGGVGTVTAGSPVPEPASLAVLGLGALALIRRRRTSK